MSITIINVEDIKAVSKEGKRKWNQSFSPLEVGKNYFYNEIEKLNLKIIKTGGFNTFKRRNLRGFVKSKNKLDYTWEAHNVDSHILCEIAVNKNIDPFHKLWKIEFHKFFRMQLHVQLPTKRGTRKQYGGTVSLGMSRGSVLKYKNNLYYLGGNSKNRITIHDIFTEVRVSRFVKKEDVEVMYRSSFKIYF